MAEALGVIESTGEGYHEADIHRLKGELLLMQGRRREALRLLAPLYDWCTEGFDTPDLQEARCLLDELSAET